MAGFFRRLLGLLSSKALYLPQAHLPSIDFRKLEEALQYKINNKQLFAEALSHRSYTTLHGKNNWFSNERLEFLGDAILNFVIAEYLYNKHLNATEGELTKIRSRLVNRKTLSIYAKHLHLDNFILIGNNTLRTQSKGMDNILANAFEALIAAIYLDGGLTETAKFVRNHVIKALDSGDVKIEDENFKSQLLEYVQAQELGNLRYVTIKEEGPDNDKTFTIEVYLNNEPCGVGMGKSKKEAEQAAAERALQKFQQL